MSKGASEQIAENGLLERRLYTFQILLVDAVGTFLCLFHPPPPSDSLSVDWE